MISKECGSEDNSVVLKKCTVTKKSAISKERILKNLLIVFLVGLLLVSAVFMVHGYIDGGFDSVETFREYVGRYGVYGPIVLGLIQMLQVIVPIIPGIIGCAAGAGIFGAAGGFWCNYIGICIGSIIAFFLAKWLGMSLVKLMFSEVKYNSWVEWIQKKKCFTWLLFLSILLPLAPDDFLCYFSGLIGMDNKKFVWIILLAKPWCILFYSVVFGYLI